MENFVLEKSAKNFRKFCNQVARVESSENSEGGCVPGWDMERPTAAKRKEGQRPSVLDSFKNLAFYCPYFCIRDRYRSLF